MDPSTLESEASGGQHGDSATASAPELRAGAAGLHAEAAGAPFAGAEQAAAGPGTSSDGALVAAVPLQVEAAGNAEAGAAPAAASSVQAELALPSGAGAPEATHGNRDAGGAMATEPFVGAEADQALSPGQAAAVAVAVPSEAGLMPVNAGGAVAAEQQAFAAVAAGSPEAGGSTSVSRSEPDPGDPGASADQAGPEPEPGEPTAGAIAADLSLASSSDRTHGAAEDLSDGATDVSELGPFTATVDAAPPVEAEPPAEPGAAADHSLRQDPSPAQSEGSGSGGGWDPPTPRSPDDEFPGEVEMPLVDHLEELRRRVLRSLLAVVVAAAACLVFVKPLVRLLEAPARGIRFLQLAPGEFLFVSLKVAGYAGLTLAIPWILFEGLAFVLPGLTRKERRLVAPTVAGSTVLFAAGLAFAWWALVPAALRFLVSYGADVVEPIWSIERYLDFVLLLMVATALAFQLPVLQLLLGALGLVDARRMLGAWRWVVLISALAGAVLTPSTDPVTMLLLSGAITALYLIGIGLVALAAPRRRQADPA